MANPDRENVTNVRPNRHLRKRKLVRTIFMVVVAAVTSITGISMWPQFCLWRADASLKCRNQDAAASWLSMGLWDQRTDRDSCLIQLRLARRQHRFGEVERLLELARQLKIPHAAIQREQWLACVETQQFDQMQSHWLDLLSDPRDDEPEIARAYVTWACGRHLLDQAHQVIDVWHKDFPRDPEPLALRGRLYMAANLKEDAAAAYQKALELAPANDEYRLNLAELLRQQLKFDESAQLYQQSLQSAPGNVTAITGLAQNYTSQGKVDAAIELLKDAVGRYPENLDLAQSFGEVLLAAGKDQLAANELERVYRAHPENSDLAYSFGRALKGCGREQDAAPLFAFVAESREYVDQLKELELQLRKEPNNLELRMKIAAITAKYKSRRDAIRWYENLLNLYPHHGPTHAALAELYRQEGDEAQAHSHQMQSNQAASGN